MADSRHRPPALSYLSVPRPGPSRSDVLPCSDLFHQLGDVVTSADVLAGGMTQSRLKAHPVLMDYVPLTPATRRRLNELADRPPHHSPPCTIDVRP